MIEQVKSWKTAEMPQVAVWLGKKTQYCNIYTLADLHIGSRETDEKAIKSYIDYIKADRNGYVILNGDLCDCGIEGSATGPYEQRMNTDEQIDYVCELLAPIKDKILVTTQGNHERRIEKKTSIDIASYIAIKLGIDDRYLKNGGNLKIRLGDNKSRGREVCYDILVEHGTGGGGTSGSKLNRAEKMELQVICDIYLMSHVHCATTSTRSIFVQNANGAPTKQNIYFMTSNAWQRYGGYGHAGQFAPGNIEQSIIKLSGKQKRVSIISHVDPYDIGFYM